MVKRFTTEEKHAVADAVTKAERKTSAEIVVAVAEVSDAYLFHAALYGFLFGSLTALVFWAAGVVRAFPPLLALQLAMMGGCILIPRMRRALLPLVPARVRRHQAKRKAFVEYSLVSQHVPAAVPLVLVYLSLAERYIHILPARILHAKLPSGLWNEIVEEFRKAQEKLGPAEAAIAAVEKIGQECAAPYPATGVHHLRRSVIEIRGT